MKKVLFIGLGSIGQRHLRNLLQTGSYEIIAWRKRGNPLPDEFANIPISTFSSLRDALREEPDFAIISAPPVTQKEALGSIVRAGIPFFIEKPIAPDLAGMDELVKIVNEKKLVSMVGYNLRFHPVHNALKEIIASGGLGNIASIRASVGQYLPDWHPYEDYRQGYSARKDLGGGVILDLIHEIDFVYSLFGKVSEVKSFFGKRSGIEINTEDTAEILLQFESGIIGSVHVDYVQRRPFRNGMIIGDQGTLLYDLLLNEVKYLSFDKDKDFVKSFEFNRNDMYMGELTQFIDALEGKASVSSDFSSGLEVLKIAMLAKSEA